jgi:hypothetical protein
LSNTAIVVALLVGVAVWFAVASRLTAKPWDNREQAGDVGAVNFAPARIGLWLFMAVVTSLFSLFLTAYSMRMHAGVGWCHLTMPRIVWLNTLVLVAASVAMQLASIGVGVRRWVTMHGFAFNVSPDLTGFARINPCGFTDCPVTSLAAERGYPVSVGEVKEKVAACFGKLLEERLPCKDPPEGQKG